MAAPRRQWLVRTISVWHAMRLKPLGVGVAVGSLWVARRFVLATCARRHTRLTSGRVDDCSISERGPDGVPLSLYAG